MISNYIIKRKLENNKEENYIILDNIPKLTSNTTDKEQYDDELTEYNNTKSLICNYWKSIPQFEQKSNEWLNQRKNYIGGSEAGAILGYNHYEPQFKAIEKKLITIPIINKIHTYHGNKYEDVAILIYEWLRNVRIDNYGFLPHNLLPNNINVNNRKDINFIGASPDGIISDYKYDRIHKTKENGIMIEIKCPPNRKINMDVNAKIEDIIPIYYYYQIQQQMETCELNETDFVQIKVIEYSDTKKYKARELFNKDVNPNCLYKTKDNKFKGAVIQILPNSFKGKAVNSKKFDTPELKSLQQQIYDQAKFIHQPKLNMSPSEIKQWIINVKNQSIPNDISELDKELHYIIKDGYVFHKVFYWKLDYGRFTRIKRNKIEFNHNLIIYNNIWNYIQFLRNPINIKQHNTFINICNHINQCIEQYNKSHYNFNDQNNYLNKQNDLIMNILKLMFENDFNSNIVQDNIKEFKNYFDDITIYNPSYKLKNNNFNNDDIILDF